MDATFSKPVNPLAGFMRQPKIYIRLPSNGEYWPEGSLEPTETGEYPVYSMTANDELMLKIPDALLNGQAVVEVIQNCVPNVKNAWDCPNIDMDLLLIAIRLATYGEKMSTPIKLGDDIEMEYQVDLRTVMDNLLNSSTWDPVVPINSDLTVFVKPMNYRHMTQAALQTFETQKIIQMVNNDGLTEDDKINLFKESFTKLSGATLGTIEHSIARIESSQGSTDNPEFIREFVSNVDKEIFNKIQLHLEDLRNKNSIKPVTVQVTEEMKERGFTGDTVEIPLTFDPSTFFA
jgi:hypothetical protein